MTIKKYLKALFISAIPMVLFGIFYFFSEQHPRNTDSMIYVLLLASFVSNVLSVIAVFTISRKEPTPNRSAFMLILMPTFYIFPIILAWLAFLAMLPWASFHLSF